RKAKSPLSSVSVMKYPLPSSDSAHPPSPRDDNPIPVQLQTKSFIAPPNSKPMSSTPTRCLVVYAVKEYIAICVLLVPYPLIAIHYGDETGEPAQDITDSPISLRTSMVISLCA